ncbi:MAG: chemotaxis protein CheA [bacterium]
MVDEMDMSQYKEMFISEAQEHLQEMNRALLELEKSPQDENLLNQIFRGSHTLKGMAATMGYESITKLSHHMEDVLDTLKKGGMKVNPEVVNILFECFDLLHALVDEVVTGEDKGLDIEPIAKKLEAVLEGKAGEEKTEVVKPETEKEQQAKVAAITEQKTETVRVNIKQLDALMNLVGELVINKAQLVQISTRHQITELSESLSQVDRIASELQTEVLKTRMVPVSLIFDRFPRVVRDISKARGKEIELEITGREIEIDRMILEELNDPLVHLMRNAVDHGVESPDEREAVHKPRVGIIRMVASRGKGFVTIEISDDGKGIDPEKIKQIAVKRGIVTIEEAEQLSKRQALALIYDPRFTTTTEVSDISGRGVGMDVVKTKIESFNGSLEIRSEVGKGTKFILKLPLTLAIIKALLIKIKSEIYAIPLSNITEILHVKRGDIKTVEKEEVIMFREKVLPLKRLNELFGDTEERRNTDYLSVVAVESSGREVGVVIDSFLGQEEIVIKTLGGLLKKVRGFSGSTILGDGRVVLIVDVNSLV